MTPDQFRRNLPASGWRGHGRPGFLCEAARNLRHAAIASDNTGHTLREIAFRQWCDETVFPEAVNRRIAEIFAAHRTSGPQSPMPNVSGVGSTSRQQPKGGQ